MPSQTPAWPEGERAVAALRAHVDRTTEVLLAALERLPADAGS